MKPEDPTSWIRAKDISREDARRATITDREHPEPGREEIEALQASWTQEQAERQALAGERVRFDQRLKIAKGWM